MERNGIEKFKRDQVIVLVLKIRQGRREKVAAVACHQSRLGTLWGRKMGEKGEEKGDPGRRSSAHRVNWSPGKNKPNWKQTKKNWVVVDTPLR